MQSYSTLPGSSKGSPEAPPNGYLKYSPVAVLGFTMGCFFIGQTSSSSGAMPMLSAATEQHPHLVVGLPDLPQEYTGKQFAGFVPTNDKHPELDSHLFYWLLESEKSASKSALDSPLPLVIWLNGGPGASSLTGVLLENGPFRLNADSSLTYNEYGWTQEAHMVAIDQPVGAGFSYTSTEDIEGEGYVNSLDEMAEQLYSGIVNLLDLHPWLEDSPIYISGESYAGKYIPAISHYIHTQGNLNLAGIAIGNGQLKPYTAYASTPDYLHNLGLIDDKQQQWAHEALVECKAQVDSEAWVDAFKTCQDIEDKLFSDFVQIPFIYDIREKSDIFTDCKFCELRIANCDARRI